MIADRKPSFPRSAWERTPGRSAARLAAASITRAAERRSVRSHAERGNEGSRPAFTLVELMVAMALTLFVMVILTQAFVTSLATFSTLKSIGEMQANLRTVSSLLQADLASDHFEGKLRLSNPGLLTTPPSQGFFYIYQGSASVNAAAAPPYPPYVIEGCETGFTPLGVPTPPGLQSWRANNHVLYFTVRLRGNRPESFMTAPLPAGSPLLGSQTTFFGQSSDAMYVQPGSTFFSSQWAEVCYFLVQTGSTTEPGNAAATTGTPLFALYRAQYLLVMNPTNLSVSPVTPNPYPNISTKYNALSSTLSFNAPDDVVSGNRTLDPTASPYPTRASDVPLPAGTPPSGATLVLSNVTSFQVQVFTQQAGSLRGDRPAVCAGPDFTYVAAAFPASFDAAAKNAYTILAVKATIRIWDAPSQLSRQVTIIQDM